MVVGFCTTNVIILFHDSVYHKVYWLPRRVKQEDLSPSFPLQATLSSFLFSLLSSKLLQANPVSFDLHQIIHTIHDTIYHYASSSREVLSRKIRSNCHDYVVSTTQSVPLLPTSGKFATNSSFTIHKHIFSSDTTASFRTISICTPSQSIATTEVVTVPTQNPLRHPRRRAMEQPFPLGAGVKCHHAPLASSRAFPSCTTSMATESWTPPRVLCEIWTLVIGVS